MALFGLSDDRHAPMSAYSKGMRQKILISAALLHDPAIMILDEPNSGLDVTTTFVLRSLIQTLAGEGRMVIYSSHVLESVERVATDVIILNDGKRRRSRFGAPAARAARAAVARAGLPSTGHRNRHRSVSPAISSEVHDYTLTRGPRCCSLARSSRRFFESDLLPPERPPGPDRHLEPGLSWPLRDCSTRSSS